MEAKKAVMGSNEILKSLRSGGHLKNIAKALENQQRNMLWGIKECGVNLERAEHWNRSGKTLATS